MENMVNIYLFGKQYSVPDNLTIMRAMEYAGYQLVKGFFGKCEFDHYSAAAVTVSAALALRFIVLRATENSRPVLPARQRLKTICISQRFLSSLL